MQSMRSKRGAQEQGDLEVAHPTLSTTGARNLKGVKQSTTARARSQRRAVSRIGFGWQRYLSVQRSTHTVGDGSVSARVSVTPPICVSLSPPFRTVELDRDVR